MLKEHHLPVTKTARYYTFGQPTHNTRYVWFVLHGYGQAASGFMNNFTQLNPARHFIVAPEGLSRFYWNGFTGPPVASWMTSADRLNEIHDYIQYLNNLYEQVMRSLPDGCRPEINLLGFSQGATTLSRWFANGQILANRLIFWAGGLAHDIDWHKATPLFNQASTYLFYGTDDPLISAENMHLQNQLLHQHQIPFKAVSFKGAHEIQEAVLLDHFNNPETTR
ncbi:phospholipase [Sphingobacteriales bacterium UPWRP_1]|nr:hypothetical protein BVG80_10630 [Sphingobacteriales bacterium TSM_CSM]PSJ78871.1 phospholipase [Sphingobacteriales bacterium UPWRP_1]